MGIFGALLAKPCEDAVNVVLSEAGVIGKEALAQHRAQGGKERMLVLGGDGRARGGDRVERLERLQHLLERGRRLEERVLERLWVRSRRRQPRWECKEALERLVRVLDELVDLVDARRSPK